MSEKNNISDEESSKNKKNSVGEILRQQRISMNFSVDKLSKDLRIGKSYIEAIEEDKFDLIPAPTYVRVYVKTIAQYLSLDSSALLEQLYKENNKIAGLHTKEKQIEGEPLSVSVSEQKKNGKFGFIALLFILLLILVFVVNQDNNLSIDENPVTEETETSTEIISEEQEPDEFENLLSDSSVRGDTIIDEIAEDSVVADTSIAVVETAVTPEKINLTLQVVKDSSWIMIISDGQKVFEDVLLAPSKTIEFSATDSINAISGNMKSAVEISINGAKKELTGTRWTFTKDSTKNLNLQQWEKIRTAAEKKAAE